MDSAAEGGRQSVCGSTAGVFFIAYSTSTARAAAENATCGSNAGVFYVEYRVAKTPTAAAWATDASIDIGEAVCRSSPGALQIDPSRSRSPCTGVSRTLGRRARCATIVSVVRVFSIRKYG